MANTLQAKRFRSIFVSDIHLGTKGCQAELLLDFMRHHDAHTWYLVGDIIDTWRLRRRWYWPQSHNDVVQKFLRKSRKGATIIFIPGNHDEPFRHYCGTHFGDVQVRRDAIHTAADGRRFLIVHGDEFDGVIRYAKWLAILGDYGYRALLSANTGFNRLRHRLGFGYWSLSAYVKGAVKNALHYIEDYETALMKEAQKRGVDGVICGHIHKAEIRRMGNILYLNDGDWVESATAIVEHMDGQFELIHWAGQAARKHSDSAPADRKNLANLKQNVL